MTRGTKITLAAVVVGGLGTTAYLLARAKPVAQGGAVAAWQNAVNSQPFADQTGFIARLSNGLADFLNVGASKAPAANVPKPSNNTALNQVENQAIKDTYDWLSGNIFG